MRIMRSEENNDDLSQTTPMTSTTTKETAPLILKPPKKCFYCRFVLINNQKRKKIICVNFKLSEKKCQKENCVCVPARVCVYVCMNFPCHFHEQYIELSIFFCQYIPIINSYAYVSFLIEQRTF